MWQAPEAGDIVWCRFPQRPRDKPGPKSRPALVVSVVEYDDGISVAVAYGTSKKLDRMLSGEFAIRKAAHSAAYAMAGLSFDTKFNLRNMVDLPWHEDFFGVAPDAIECRDRAESPRQAGGGDNRHGGLRMWVSAHIH